MGLRDRLKKGVKDLLTLAHDAAKHANEIVDSPQHPRIIVNPGNNEISDQSERHEEDKARYYSQDPD